MKQAVAIFRKDASRSRAHIALVAAVTALVAILTPRHTIVYSHDGQSLNRAIDLLQIFLLPLSWWLALAHAIHAEPLAGDRAFWLTRPYSWRSLFAAKLLFCAAFLLLPFLLADCYIMWAMGFSPAAVFPGLVRHTLSAGVFYATLAALLAVVTRTTRQFILTAIAALVAISVTVPMLARPVYPALDFAPPSRVDWWVVGWCVLTLAFLLWTYAYRRIFAARVVLGAAIAFVLVSSATSSRAYVAPPPQPLRHPEIAVAFAPERRPGPTYSGNRNKVQIEIPIELSGRDPALLDWEIYSVSIGGSRLPPPLVARKDSVDAIEIFLDPADYELVSRAAVRLDAILAVNVYDFVRHVSLPLNERWTEVPGIGFARLIQAPPWTRVEWRTPLRLPAERLAYDIHGQLNVAPFFSRSARGYPDEQPFHSSPVQTWTDPVGAPMGDGIWSVDITIGQPVDRLRRDLSIRDLRLSDWVMAK